MRPSIRRAIVLIVLVLHEGISHGAHAGPGAGLKFDALEARHSADGHIEFGVVNESNQAFLFSATVESYFDDAWREIAYSIKRSDPAKAAILMEISPGQRQELVWDEVDLPIRPGRYRFRLDVFRDDGSKPMGEVRSRVFQVLP